MKKRGFARALLALVVATMTFVAGCGASVSPMDGGMDASVRVCRLPEGGTCPAGQSCPAGDGCNTCSCDPNTLQAQCTLIACSVDAGPGRCGTQEDCRDGRECVFSVGCCGDECFGTCELPTPCFQPQPYCSCDNETYESCAPTRRTRAVGACAPRTCNPTMRCRATEECIYPVAACGANGVCREQTDCAATQEFCGCDGVTYRACPAAPTRPTRAVGACTSMTDGGTVDAGGSCVGARLDAAAGRCTNASGTVLAPECCTGWNCSGTAVCEIVPPVCMPGWVASVVGSCWGPCVPAANCGR
jgi:hypothetical protein